jgi:hypothetical protein
LSGAVVAVPFVGADALDRKDLKPDIEKAGRMARP